MKFIIIIILSILISGNNSQYELPVRQNSEVNEPYCPPEHEITRELINRFLTNEGTREQQQRRELQTRPVQTADISLLVEENDGEICRQISKRFPWKKQRETLIRTYYKTDQNYFIVNYTIKEGIEKKTGYGIQFSGQFIVQLDNELNHMGAAVMHKEEY